MKIKLNGKVETLKEEMTLADLLQMKELNLQRIVVEYNKKIVKRDEWKEIMLNDNDVLEILKFVGGG